MSASVTSLVEGVPKFDKRLQLPSYYATFLHPGGVRDARHMLSYYEAIMMSQFQEGKDIDLDFLEKTNVRLNRNTYKLSCHDPTAPVSGFRDDNEIYHYPNCPRGWPVNELHLFVFSEDQNKIEKYNKLLTPKVENGIPTTWFDLIESGYIPNDDKKALFNMVSIKTHGSVEEFKKEWNDFITSNSREEFNPIFYATKLHNIILQYMPFKRANRRLARFVLGFHLSQNGIIPPIFFSSTMYDLFVCKATSVDIKKLASGSTDLSQDVVYYEHFYREFVKWIAHLCIEGEKKIRGYSSSQMILLPYESPLMRGDFTKGLEMFMTGMKRVIIPEIIIAFSVWRTQEEDISLTKSKNEETSTKPSGYSSVKETYKSSKLIPLRDEKGNLIYTGVDSTIVDAIKELMAQGKIKYTKAHKYEYLVKGQMPIFKNPEEKKTWEPMAITFVKVDN